MTLHEYRTNILNADDGASERSNELPAAATSVGKDSAHGEHERHIASFVVAPPHAAESWCHKGEWHMPRMKSSRPDGRDCRRPVTLETPPWLYAAR